MAQRAETLPQTRTAQPHRSSTTRRVLGPDWKIALPFILPIIILMTIFIAWPFIRAIFTSMTIRTMARETKFVGLDNYIRLYSDPYYHQAVKATFVFTANAILFKLIFGLIAATLLHPLKRGRNLLTGLVLLPWIIPSVVQALASSQPPLAGVCLQPAAGSHSSVVQGLPSSQAPWGQTCSTSTM